MILCTRVLFWIIFANNYKYLIDFTRIIQGFGDSMEYKMGVERKQRNESIYDWRHRPLRK